MQGELISSGKAAFLNLRRMPAMLNSEQVATLLGCHPDCIPILVSAGQLKPLGNPGPNAVKQFARCDILEKGEDPAWLDKTSRVLSRYWRHKNAKHKGRLSNPGSDSFADRVQAQGFG